MFEVKVDPALVAGKSVRIVHVHGGVAETITPISVDRETGIVTFAAQKFSTYALLTSSTLTVTFDSGQGTGVAAQQVAFDGKVAKPADPTLSGHVFAGWYTDQACTHAYDFASPVQTSFTLYAKWMWLGNPGGDDPSGQGGNQGEGTSGSGSSGTGTGSGSGSGSGSGHKGSVLVTTGDPLGVPMAALGVVAFAAAVLGAWAAPPAPQRVTVCSASFRLACWEGVAAAGRDPFCMRGRRKAQARRLLHGFRPADPFCVNGGARALAVITRPSWPGPASERMAPPRTWYWASLNRKATHLFHDRSV